jgi:uncharacterized membrane protein YfcA
MFKGIITLILVAGINVLYVWYLHCVKQDRVVASSLLSMMINLAGSIAAIFFVEQNWIIVPSCIGSFVGTWLGLKLTKHLEKS